MSRFILAIAVVSVLGCGDSETSDEAASPGADPAVTSTDTVDHAGDVPTKKKRSFKPITLGSDDNKQKSSAKSSSSGDRLNSVIDRLKPIQVVLGNWRGTTRREFGGFKAVDQHEWLWDLSSQPEQPALVMASEKSPYIRQARMTWLTDDQRYRLTIVSPKDETRVFTGEFAAPVQDVIGDDGKLQRTFHLKFTQTEPADSTEQWQFAFNQVENNRYLLEVSKKRGKATFRRIDTVSTQRDGTSFAISDTDYGEKTCIISQGLGTMTVSYKGRTFWVCCTGCKAAFEEEPERWIKRFEEEMKQ